MVDDALFSRFVYNRRYMSVAGGCCFARLQAAEGFEFVAQQGFLSLVYDSAPDVLPHALYGRFMSRHKIAFTSMDSIL